MAPARRISWDAGFWIAGVVALGLVSIALATGVAPGRARPTAGFAGIWVAAASYVLVAKHAMRRRMDRLRTAPIPHGVRLVRPIWMPLRDFFTGVALAGGMGAIAAACGFPWVGGAIVLALTAVGIIPMLVPTTRVLGLTFEPDGLRLHFRRGHGFLLWTSVLEVGVKGTLDVPAVNVQVADPGALHASLSSDSRATRVALQVLLGLGEPKDQALCFLDWSAGLDSATLARGMREAMGEPATRAN